ncbi:hypothetical protein C469_02821 [Halorubrum lipolyticum DSM 21995]|uniref:Zinc-ribbon domain-containing protein n=1 Tax=Halorubrum lipolyticum DSM 21995 TaxID=1227482 RepID=M0P1L9_9EURY|nr:hypothetical protein C469_02821 [Halorubrum lipolyticum DSM 21995]
MGDQACDRRFCPECDLAVSRVDDTCPDCGARLEPVEG